MRLSEQDASFLYTETASGPMQTAGIMVIDGELSFEEVCEFYAARIHLVPRLRQRLVFVPMNLAHPKWVEDPDFDLKNHFVHHELPPGSSMTDGIAALAKLNQGVMDRNLPLWKYFVVTGVKDRTLVLQQMHHAMVDGASTVQMATVLFDYSADALPPEPPAERSAAPPLPSPVELMTEALQDNVQAALNINPLASLSTSEAQTHLRRGFETMSRFVTNPSITAPWNASTVGPDRKLTWSEHPMSEFREIRRAFGGTINDIALAAVSEGAARYLDKHNEQNEGRNFRVMCPVNVRTESEGGNLGNQVSAIFPMLPASSMEVTERLAAVVKETSRIKEGQEAQAMTYMQESSVSIAPILMAPLLLVGTPFDPTRFAANNPPPVLPPFGARPPGFGVNFVLTNVPGVQVPQYIAGKEIIATLGLMMLTGNMGLGVAVGSYNQKMFFNLTADPRLLPDLEMFTDEVTNTFDELLISARRHNETVSEKEIA
ncbi:MAG: WS/DGAT domain-containing protein [Gammaproteobacteria bacterium]|nr:WS/DGAT domain-containing protein [Gammaproteobacteria bacterium]